jgi:hypothetical protein
LDRKEHTSNRFLELLCSGDCKKVSIVTSMSIPFNEKVETEKNKNNFIFEKLKQKNFSRIGLASVICRGVSLDLGVKF